MKHLLMEASDHAPLFLLIMDEPDGGEKPFRFFQAWTRDPSSFDVVKGTWNSPIRGGMEAHKLGRKLNNTARALSRWNKSHFGMAQ